MNQRRPRSRRAARLAWTWAFVTVVVVVGAWLAVRSFRAGLPEVHVPGEGIDGITDSLSRAVAGEAPEPAFTDVTEEAGLSFQSFVGARSSQLPEDMGPGAAWGDFDADGDEDLFLVSAGGSLDQPRENWGRSELFENLADGRFRRVAGFPEVRVIGMAAAWGDVDGDGWLDLVVTGYRTLQLFRNQEGTFVQDSRFPSPDGFWAGASWADFDRDGDLDLYVCGYVRYREEKAERARQSMQYGKSVPYTMNPSAYSPERNLLLRNRGDGRFDEVAAELGVSNPEGRSLGALWHDINEDGWLDLYIANDISDNVLYLNREGSFEDVSHAAWVADYRGAMGLAAGDWNADGDDDLFVTHWMAQENALYDSLRMDLQAGETPVKDAEALVRFMDVADERGLGQSALSTVGWGAEFTDLDADGWLDLLVSNGSTFETEQDPPQLQPQRMFVLWNRAGDGFDDLAPLDPVLSQPVAGRGLAVADYDLDGDPDFVQMRLDGGVRLFRNDLQGGHWIQFQLRSRSGAGGEARGYAEGAALIARVGERTVRRSVTGVSYLSQSSRVVHMGLGPAVQVDDLEVRWPGGTVAHYRNLEAGQRWEIREGEPEPRAQGRAHAATPLDSRERQLAFWKAQRAAVDAMKNDRDTPRAMALFEEALSLDPSHEDSLYYLGHCQMETGDPEAALATFGRLTEVNPMSHRGWRQWAMVRATTATTSGQLAEAARALEQALSVNPEETGVLVRLAEVELMQSKSESAAQRLKWACRTNPRAVGGFFLLAYLAWQQGDREAVAEHLVSVRAARGPAWKPAGTVAEGDVETSMHRDSGLLSRFWESWSGEEKDAASVFAALDEHLIARRSRLQAD